MDNKFEFNNKISECVHYKMNVGSTEYVNICTGDTNYVSWGACDWMAFGFLTVIGLLSISFLGYMLISIIRD